MKGKILIALIFIGVISCLSLYKDTTMPKIENFEIKQFETNKNEIKIGIISDTHIPDRVKVLPKEIKDAFKDVDLIIHAGDFTNLETLNELEKIAPVFAVEGNTDRSEIKDKLPEGLILEIFNFKIGISHSSTHFWLLSHLDFLNKLAEKLAKKENFDIFIFGHTHLSFLKELDGNNKKILLMNSGSPTTPFLSNRNSIGLLKITKDSFNGEIIPIKQ